MRPDGSDLKRLTTSPGSDTEPDWSPDGSKIVFTSTRSGSSDIWLMDADGSNQTQITDIIHSEFYPRWSPDGSKIMFTVDSFLAIDLHLVNPDGSNIEFTQFRRYPYATRFGDWSPDELNVVFSSRVYSEFNLFKSNINGNTWIQVTFDDKREYYPSWSPL
ncbi:TolB family protein [candidate division KSB1 bacterium]